MTWRARCRIDDARHAWARKFPANVAVALAYCKFGQTSNKVAEYASQQRAQSVIGSGVEPARLSWNDRFSGAVYTSSLAEATILLISEGKHGRRLRCALF